MPVANASIFSLLGHLISDFEFGNDLDLLPFASLCRNGFDCKDSCERDVAKLLYQMVCLAKPKTVIEVGVFRGAASCHLASALQRNANGAELHLVDIARDHLEAAGSNLTKFGLSDGVFFYFGDSADLAMTGKLPSAELVFLDGDHDQESVRRDIKAYWPLIRIGGLLVLHDSIMWNGVRFHVNELARLLPDSVYTLATSGGSGVSVVHKLQESLSMQ